MMTPSKCLIDKADDCGDDRRVTRSWKRKRFDLKKKEDIKKETDQNDTTMEEAPQPKRVIVVLNTSNSDNLIASFQNIRQPDAKSIYVDTIQRLKIRSKLKPSKIIFRCSHDVEEDYKQDKPVKIPRKRKKRVKTQHEDGKALTETKSECNTSFYGIGIPENTVMEYSENMQRNSVELSISPGQTAHGVHNESAPTHPELYNHADCVVLNKNNNKKTCNTKEMQATQVELICSVGGEVTDDLSNPSIGSTSSLPKPENLESLVDFIVDTPYETSWENQYRAVDVYNDELWNLFPDVLTENLLSFPISAESNMLKNKEELGLVCTSSNDKSEDIKLNKCISIDSGFSEDYEDTALNDSVSVETLFSDEEQSSSSSNENDLDTSNIEKLSVEKISTNPEELIKLRYRIKETQEKATTTNTDERERLKLLSRLKNQRIDKHLEEGFIKLKGLLMEKERLEYYINKVKRYLHDETVTEEESRYLMEKVNMTLNDRVAGNLRFFIDAVLEQTMKANGLD